MDMKRRSANRMSCILYSIVGGLIIQALLASACTNQEQPNQGSVIGQANTASQKMKSVDHELTALIKTYSEDVGEEGQAAWQKLQSYPRKDLIDYLLGLQNSLPKDDPRQYSTAFVLCNLDHEYPTNVGIIVSALINLPHNQNANADTAAAMLGRLIHRGDKGLLRVIFEAVPYSDAALGETLTDILPEELRNNPKEFLLQLKDKPKDTRSKVYKLIGSGSLTAEDVKKLRSELTSLSQTVPISQVAKEMLASPLF